MIKTYNYSMHKLIYSVHVWREINTVKTIGYVQQNTIFHHVWHNAHNIHVNKQFTLLLQSDEYRLNNLKEHCIKMWHSFHPDKVHQNNTISSIIIIIIILSNIRPIVTCTYYRVGSYHISWVFLPFSWSR